MLIITQVTPWGGALQLLNLVCVCFSYPVPAVEREQRRTTLLSFHTEINHMYSTSCGRAQLRKF